MQRQSNTLVSVTYFFARPCTDLLYGARAHHSLRENRRTKQHTNTTQHIKTYANDRCDRCEPRADRTTARRHNERFQRLLRAASRRQASTSARRCAHSIAFSSPAETHANGTSKCSVTIFKNPTARALFDRFDIHSLAILSEMISFQLRA